MPVHTTFDIRQGGTIDINGAVDPSDNSVQMQLQVKSVELPTFQPYLAPDVNLALAGGTFSGDGRLQTGNGVDTPKLDFEGGFDVSGLKFVENHPDQPLVGCERLKTSKLRFSLAPDRLDIEDVKLTRVDGKVIISENGTINVAEIIRFRGRMVC